MVLRSGSERCYIYPRYNFYELVKPRNRNTSRQNRLLEYGKNVHVSRNSKLQRYAGPKPHTRPHSRLGNEYATSMQRVSQYRSQMLIPP